MTRVEVLAKYLPPPIDPAVVAQKSWHWRESRLQAFRLLEALARAREDPDWPPEDTDLSAALDALTGMSGLARLERPA